MILKIIENIEIECTVENKDGSTTKTYTEINSEKGALLIKEHNIVIDENEEES